MTYFFTLHVVCYMRLISLCCVFIVPCGTPLFMSCMGLISLHCTLYVVCATYVFTLHSICCAWYLFLSVVRSFLHTHKYVCESTDSLKAGKDYALDFFLKRNVSYVTSWNKVLHHGTKCYIMELRELQ